MHACRHGDTHTHTHIHTEKQIYRHAHINPFKHTHTHTQTHTCTYIMKPPGKTARYGEKYHLSADDTQLYVSQDASNLEHCNTYNQL